MYVYVYIQYAVREDSVHNIARRLRRRGFDAHVRDGRVLVYNLGAYKEALNEIHNVMARIAPDAVAVDWGVYEE